MITDQLLEKARLHVRRWFARRMPDHMVFHDLEHTLSVARSAVGIAQAMKLPRAEINLLELAALFHDTGYAVSYTDHEQEGADLAEAFLRKKGVPERDIQRVRGLILATRLGAVPRSRLQKILRDADSSKAGQVDFDDHGERLRQEIGAVRGTIPSIKDWLAENLAYLGSHEFHTEYAQERYGGQKRMNLEALLERSKRSGTKLKPTVRVEERFFERDLSWLSFNDRVLQEAKDPSVPLLERIKFLAIYSSNLDEFYRVRVASLRSLSKLKKVTRTVLDVPAGDLVERINKKALRQQKEFGALYRNVLLPALAREGIRILGSKQLSAREKRHLRTLFKDRIAANIHTAEVRPGNAPFIEDRKLYFVCSLRGERGGRERLMLLNIPSEELGRFIPLPGRKGQTRLVFLDDAVRLCLNDLFPDQVITDVHAIKLSRDAELYLGEEFIGNVKEKVRKSLRKRQTGVPSRFLYDSAMPPDMLRALRTLLGLNKQDLVPGGRYHNFNDLFDLPIRGHADLRDRPWPALRHPDVPEGRSILRATATKDMLWHFPYHDFGMLVDLLNEASHDPRTVHIQITLYRVAEDSAVCAALLEALKRGKKVTVFVEVQARFDEHANLFWGEALEKAGARVLYSYENLKVHCKLCLIERTMKRGPRLYAYLGTGNFNERTSRIYSDSALLTTHSGITMEVAEVFRHLVDRRHRPDLDLLMMAPLTLRDRLEALIDKEIEHAVKGRKAEILLKLNSLEDRALIRKLYDASSAGVRVRLIIRGICCAVPGIAGLSANIEAISIVDRYLEHSRVYWFHNAGEPRIFLGSADWMGRNLDRRIEVAFPVLAKDLREEMEQLMELQWKDRTKARIINADQSNPYRKVQKGKKAIRAQADTYAFLKRSTR